MTLPNPQPEQTTHGATSQPTGLPNAATLAHWEKGGHATGTQVQPEQTTHGAAPQPTGPPNAATLAHRAKSGHVTGPQARPGKLIRLPVVEDRTGLGKSSIYAAVKAGTMPAPVRLSARAVAWREEEIDQWIAARLTTRGQA